MEKMMAYHSQRRLVSGLLLFALLGYSAVSIAATGTFKKSIAVNANAIVEVSNLQGNVIVRGADVDKVTIRARIEVDKRLAKTSPQKAAKLIGAIRRSPPVETIENRIVIGELKKHTHQRYATISYDIQVPSKATVKVHSVSGDVRVSGVSGTVDATSDKGEVSVAETTSDQVPDRS